MELQNFIFALLLTTRLVLAAPYYNFEDDEYDDDPELPDRKETMTKLQEDLVAPEEPSTSSTTTTEPSFSPELPNKLSSAQSQKPPQNKWIQTQEVRGYRIQSDGPGIFSQLVKTKPMIEFRVNMPDTIRQVEKVVNGNNLELKIRNWNRVHKVHIKVPFGYNPDDLKVTEKRNHISILAPVYGDVNEHELRKAIIINP